MNFYKPMLAKPMSKPFSGKDWIFETKWNGFRAIAYIRDGFGLQSRNNKELKQLTKNIVVDGEIVTMKNGRVYFHSLQETENCSKIKKKIYNLRTEQGRSLSIGKL
jgi:bifunctional non-homologous end joining protein LigD